MLVDEAVTAIVIGDHPEDGANDPAHDLAVVDLLQDGRLHATRASDGAICLELTDKGRRDLAVLGFYDDPGGE